MGNRKSTSQGGAYGPSTTITDLYTRNYTTNSLNQYTSRDVSGNIEVLGESLYPPYPGTGQSVSTPRSLVNISSPDESPAPSSTDAWRRPSSDEHIYHRRVGFDNSQAPVVSRTDTTEVPPADTSSTEVFIPKTPEAFTYDADGNLTGDGIWGYEWDAENRLKRMTMNADVAQAWMDAHGLSYSSGDPFARLEFAYDFAGRRIKKRFVTGSVDTVSMAIPTEYISWTDSYEERFIWDGWTVAMSYLADAQTGGLVNIGRSNAWGPDLSGTPQGAGGIGGLAVTVDDDYDLHHSSQALGAMFPLYDGNGNVTRVHAGTGGNAIGEPVAKYEYGPFGEVRGVFGIREQGQRNPFRWSTKWTDSETGLVCYPARYYSPSIGRWLIRDPIGESDHPNLFAFSFNTPVSLVDPTGFWTIDLTKGKFDVELGDLKETGSFITDHLSRGSSIDAKFQPDRQAFREAYELCESCSLVRFIQIIKSSYSSNAGPANTWNVDASPPPYFHDGAQSDPRYAESSLEDSPSSVFTPMIFEAETCAVCAEGNKRGAVYGCFRWGFEIKFLGLHARHYTWRMYQVQRQINGVHNPGLQGRPWTAPDGRVYNFAGSWTPYEDVTLSQERTAHLKFSSSAALAPSSTIRRLILDNPQFSREFK